MKDDEFKELLWHKAKELFRPMPWRDDTRPYYVLVSELMLQQTQVMRVIPKFEAFIAAFPDEQALATASLADVLVKWQGLGYNRRAKFLHDAATMIVEIYDGVFPSDHDAIVALPGVGKNTAGAIEAYAFNQTSRFVETNIRTVYIHHFFADDFDIDDNAIREKLDATIDREHPREFYWALMDYGSWLKANGVRNNSRSKTYKKQSALEGSVRQVRGQIIKALSSEDMEIERLKERINADERFDTALKGLLKDGLIAMNGVMVHLTK